MEYGSLYFSLCNRRVRSGQSALGLVVVIGSIVALVGVTLAFLAISFLNSVYIYDASLRARALAISGSEDGLITLVRRALPVVALPSYATSSYSYSITRSSGQAIITGTSTSANALLRREIIVNAAVDDTTGEVNIYSWQDASY